MSIRDDAGFFVSDDISVEELRNRLRSGETLHHGMAPGESSESSWWLEPSRTPVPDDVVDAMRAESPKPP